MNIKKYEAFVRAVELGSLSKAADELGYTQSGISHMMQALETEVGFPLMVRSSSGIQPNAEGELLLPVIRQLLNTNESLEQHIAQIKGCDVGRLRIAAFDSVATYWLPAIISAFQQEYPNVEIQIMEGGVDRVEETMESGEADLCIYAGGKSNSFDWIPLCEDEMLALVPPDHPLAQREEVELSALLEEQFIMPQQGYGYEVRQILDQLPHYPHIRFSACSDYVIVNMITKGLGVSILSSLLLKNYQNEAVTKHLSPRQYRKLGMGVSHLRTASPVARNFMQYVKAYVKELQREDNGNG